MRLIGVEMPERALAELALRLSLLGEPELAERIDTAARENRGELPLTAHEQAVMLQILVNPPADLHELHRALLHAYAQRPRVL